jgi:hypothetical protein
MCRECYVQCECVGSLNLSMITELSQTFLPKLSRIHILLGKIHHDINVVFISVEEFVRCQAV